MNKVILGLGILFLIIGVILVVLDLIGVFVGVGLNNPFPKMYDLEAQAFTATALLVIGGIFVFLGAKKRKSA